MLEKKRVEEILQEADVLLKGHFLLTSGRHSDKYMQCAKILQYPHFAMELVSDLAEAFCKDSVDVVIAPAVGGIVVGYELARQLQTKNLFAERENGKMTLRRGFSLQKGARVVVAEDVTTTGGTVMEVMDLVRSHGGIVVGVALLIDRSNGQVDFGVKKAAAYTAEVISYEKEECPICKEGNIPLEKPGSRSLAVSS